MHKVFTIIGVFLVKKLYKWKWKLFKTQCSFRKIFVLHVLKALLNHWYHLLSHNILSHSPQPHYSCKYFPSNLAVEEILEEPLGDTQIISMDLSREDLTAFEPDGFEEAQGETFNGMLWLVVRWVGLLWLEFVFKLSFFFRSLLLFMSCIIMREPPVWLSASDCLLWWQTACTKIITDWF